MAYQNYSKGIVKKVSFQYKDGLMLFVKKNHQKTARDINEDVPKIAPPPQYCDAFLMAENA
jgi:hypothetical protein